MRDFSKALENIRKAMREQDAEFRREEGLGPKKPKPSPQLPSLKPEPKPQTLAEGDRDPNRFLNTSIAPEHAPAPEAQAQDTAPKFVEVIPQKDGRHSWLYNEVAKAVQNASDGNPNTKVVAVFVPVVQSGHEFEELPVHETVELPPVNEEDFNVEDEIDIQADPAIPEQESEEPEELQEPEELTEQEQLPKQDELPEPEQLPEQEVLPEPEAPSQADAEPQESAEPEIPEELSAETEQATHLGELLPESIEHPDPELAEAFTTMEEKLDESISAADEQPEIDIDAAENEDAAENDAALPDLEFHDELEDDEIIDDIDESSEDTKAD